jgi:hypothetical protein
MIICQIPNRSEVPVVNLDFILANLGTLADLALLGAARIDAYDVLAVFLVGGFIVGRTVVSCANEGTVALNPSREPLGKSTVATILTDAILLAVNNGGFHELSVIGHVELFNREIGRSPQVLVALKRKLDAVGRNLRGRNNRIRTGVFGVGFPLWILGVVLGFDPGRGVDDKYRLSGLRINTALRRLPCIQDDASLNLLNVSLLDGDSDAGVTGLRRTAICRSVETHY